MRTKSEFISRVKEYGFLTYEKPCKSVGNNHDFCAFSAITAMKDGLDAVILWQNREVAISGDVENDDLVTIIGGFEKHTKLLIQILWGTDSDD